MSSSSGASWVRRRRDQRAETFSESGAFIHMVPTINAEPAENAEINWLCEFRGSAFNVVSCGRHGSALQHFARERQIRFRAARFRS